MVVRAEIYLFSPLKKNLHQLIIFAIQRDTKI